MDLGLKDKVAIITGGSEGIGRASALRLSEEGAKVAICARRADVLERAAEDIRSRTGGEVLAVAGDVCTDADVERVVSATVERFGGIDILVNNAGGSRAHPFLEATEAIWREDIEIKVFGAIRFSRAVLPHLRARGGGRIINMTTPGGKVPRKNALPTSASRALGINLTKAMANEYAPENILVNTICLGLIKSAQHERRWERGGREGGDPRRLLRADGGERAGRALRRGRGGRRSGGLSRLRSGCLHHRNRDQHRRGSERGGVSRGVHGGDPDGRTMPRPGCRSAPGARSWPPRECAFPGGGHGTSGVRSGRARPHRARRDVRR